MGQEDLKMAGGTQVMVPSNFSSALVLSSTRKSPTALCATRIWVPHSGDGATRHGGRKVGGRRRHEEKGKMSNKGEERIKKGEIITL